MLTKPIIMYLDNVCHLQFNASVQRMTVDETHMDVMMCVYPNSPSVDRKPNNSSTDNYNMMMIIVNIMKMSIFEKKNNKMKKNFVLKSRNGMDNIRTLELETPNGEHSILAFKYSKANPSLVSLSMVHQHSTRGKFILLKITSHKFSFN